MSGLPNPDRDPIGYSFQEIQLNQDAGGAVSALAQDPDATAIVALHTPGNTATGVQTDNTTADETTFAQEMGSTASVYSALYAGGRGDAASEAGDLWVRAGGTWSQVLDTTADRLTVATVGSSLWALTGGAGMPGEILSVDDTGASTTVATLDSAVPTAAIAFGGGAYVGGYDAATGAAVLYEVVGSSVDPIDLPGSAGGATVRQEVVAMLKVQTTSAAATTPAAGVTSPDYLGSVASILASRCTVCHADTNNVAAYATYPLTSSADTDADYTATQAQIDTASPADSDLLLKATNTVAHVGGGILTVGDSDYDVILAWIQDGAPLQKAATPTAPTSTNAELLFLAIASRDLQTGNPIGGFLLATSGAGFDVVRSFSGDAPTALAWEDDTIYVGTATGVLSYRDGNGLWNDESGLPTHGAITGLVGLGGGRFYLGTSNATGALLVLRTADSLITPPSTTPPSTTPPTTPPPATGGPTFVATIRPLLGSCNACHTNAAIVGSSMLYDAVDDAAAHAVITQQVDTANPGASNLLVKAAGGAGHGGGAPWAAGSSQATTVEAWIAAGAPLQ
ncbi:MAG: hypothetical protein R3B06_00005 [Kofleriaceae bacterium]